MKLLLIIFNFIFRNKKRKNLIEYGLTDKKIDMDMDLDSNYKKENYDYRTK